MKIKIDSEELKEHMMLMTCRAILSKGDEQSMLDIARNIVLEEIDFIERYYGKKSKGEKK
ncbi:hypothetical protein UFOVP150_73 [uncultured Caudovirales phage]|uniref:Uncharacterized protein n=1 Tax=uncultured Caudovirales phage TaxID=2100421 RepID=A0A6J7WB41_9CAUD|nr:hypothetical protein UFOVP150_73 [uncultured Caudovirales phage]